jgi:hypothetical protein
VSFAAAAFKKSNPADLRVDIPPQMSNGMQAYNNDNHGDHNSPTPYIKNEPQDDGARFASQQPFGNHPDAYTHFQQHQGGFGEHQFTARDSIDPSELTMPIQQNGGFMHGFSSFSNNQGLSYMSGGGGVDDEDLLATLDDRPNFEVDHGTHHELSSSLQHLFPEMDSESKPSNGISMGTHNLDQHVFSHTPENAPAASPYLRSFPTQQYRPLPGFNGTAVETPSSYNASPIIGSDSTQGTRFDQYMTTGKRQGGMERSISQQSPAAMTPHTPKTPGLAGLSLGGLESSSLPASQSTQHPLGRGHHKSLSSQWEPPGPQTAFADSPLSSPMHGPLDVFKGGKHASLPTKVDGLGNGPAYQTQEAKRRRRRESHNMVERRRRDNINERIQELSHLVPHHRLEDEKVRKHLLNSGSLSPTTPIGTSGSPPRATSMLAGGVGRRASGVPSTASLAGEEKDKGPNKGDILNGAVGWTRDLMWALHLKYEQEREFREVIARLGGTYPIEEPEEDKRMASELKAAIAKNGLHNFRYSRAPGTNLRVPGYTDIAGQPVQDPGSERVSPACSAGGKPAQNGGSSRGTPQKQQQQFWNQTEGIAFKEEDEYAGMDMS